MQFLVESGYYCVATKNMQKERGPTASKMRRWDRCYLGPYMDEDGTVPSLLAQAERFISSSGLIQVVNNDDGNGIWQTLFVWGLWTRELTFQEFYYPFKNSRTTL